MTKIVQNGRYFHLDKESDWDEASECECRCGHDLGDHRFSFLALSKKSIETNGCEKCGCIQFNINKNRSCVCA